jgi:hypothetical protein
MKLSERCSYKIVTLTASEILLQNIDLQYSNMFHWLALAVYMSTKTRTRGNMNLASEYFVTLYNWIMDVLC